MHGYSLIDANNTVEKFINDCFFHGVNKIIIITGKGSIKTGGVLRRMVPRWLNQPPLRGVVIAIEKAIPRDGGSGAYYLLLRRSR